VAKLKSGTLYPILLRLEQAKWLESRWEADDPRQLGRPRCRLYRLTGLGARKANKVLAEVRAAIRGLCMGLTITIEYAALSLSPVQKSGSRRSSLDLPERPFRVGFAERPLFTRRNSRFAPMH